MTGLKELLVFAFSLNDFRILGLADEVLNVHDIFINAAPERIREGILRFSWHVDALHLHDLERHIDPVQTLLVPLLDS